jgi:predicted ribonuclease YlaK
MYVDVGNAARNLQKFRVFLETFTTRELFTSADNLASKVTSSLHDWLLGQAFSPISSHNLPPRNFTTLLGRDADKDRVLQALESRYPLITIEGFAGVGKTSLALEVAYKVLPNLRTTILQC